MRFGNFNTEKYIGADGRTRSRIITPKMEKQRTLASLPDYKKPFLQGSSYGVEDEKRFLQSIGVQTGQPGTPDLTAQVDAIQADIAKQLQIVQQEKSAVSKMTEDYTKMLKAEADAKRKAQEEERVALQTARANQARAGQQANLQIQPAGRTPTTAGTQGFRARRVSRLKSTPISSALNIGTAQTLNI